MRVIVRYKQRGLRDLQDKRQTSLEELKELLQAGEPFKVVCEKTRNDITKDTLFSMAYKFRDKIPEEAIRGVLSHLK